MENFFTYVYKNAWIRLLLFPGRYSKVILIVLTTAFFNSDIAMSDNKIDFEYIKKLKKGNEEQQRLYPTTIRYAFNAYMEPYGIIIDGELKTGDFEKFLELVKNGKGEIKSVWLRSLGGDATEAMKIGELIRKLKLSTSVPGGDPENPLCTLHPPNKKENCTCASACFLIFVAGIKRDGSVAGIHRGYQSHSYLEKISLSEASKSSEKINIEIRKYLKLMGVPTEIAERSIATSSKDIYFLGPTDVKTYFNGYTPETDEWFLAKCGDSKSVDSARKKEFDKNINSVKGQKLSDQLDKIIMCQLRKEKEIIKDSYKEYFK